MLHDALLACTEPLFVTVSNLAINQAQQCKERPACSGYLCVEESWREGETRMQTPNTFPHVHGHTVLAVDARPSCVRACLNSTHLKGITVSAHLRPALWQHQLDQEAHWKLTST